MIEPEDDAAEPSEAPVSQGPERDADALLALLYASSPRGVFDNTDAEDSAVTDPAQLTSMKAAGDLLVRARLARFTDEARADIEITNAGRYWALNGGYMAYLKEEPPAGGAGGGGGRQRNLETEALRAEYMKLRLGTFWWQFGLSVAGFIMSIVSLIIAIFFGDRLLR